MTTRAELGKLHQTSPLVELFTIDLTTLGGGIYRFTPGFAETGSLVHAGLAYSGLPITSEGWEVSASGTQPRPTLQVSNVKQTILAAIQERGDMVGARVTRLRTYAKFLDEASFVRINMANNSENLATYWTKNQTTVVSSVTTAPNGTMTADWLKETTGSGSHHVGRSFSYVAGRTYTYSVYVKAGGRSDFRLVLPSQAFGDSGPGTGQSAFCNFNLDTLAITGTVNCRPQISDAGDGWRRCSVSQTASASSSAGGSNMRILNRSFGAGESIDTYTGDANKGIYLWGIQIEEADGPTLYQMTTTTHQPFADPNDHLPLEVYQIEQMVSLTNSLVTFQLSSPLERFGSKLPGRQILKDQSTKNLYAPGISRYM